MSKAYLSYLIEEKDGQEIVKETYGQDGTKHARIETDYNQNGLVTEIREFSDDFINAFKVSRFSYNEQGNLVMEQVFHDEVQTFGMVHQYDTLGRLLQSRATDEEGVHHDVFNVYDIGAMHPKSQTYLNGTHCWKEIHFEYGDPRDKSRVTQETIDNKDYKFQSRIARYYIFGTKPNGVVAEYYNANGRFLEEVREIHDEKGRLLQEATFADDADDAIPYAATAQRYDQNGNVTLIEDSYHNSVTGRQIAVYDSKNRKRMEIVSGAESSLLVYQYED